MTANVTTFQSSPLLLLKPEFKTYYPFSVGINGDSKFSSNLSGNSTISRRTFAVQKEKNGPFPSGSGFLPTERNKEINLEVERELKSLWDDGYGTQTVKDYIEAAKDMIKSDGGPPRWFCPIESGPALKNSPVLLYLPGTDGLGMGLILHHKALGKVFQVRCLHIPVHDRTPYEKLVKFVQDAVRDEHASFPNRPIYLVGDSFGGCLALSVAALNPSIDLVLILVNPATSFNRSQLQHLLPFLKAIPEELHTLLPYIFGATLGDPIKMANVRNVKTPSNSPSKQIENLIHELSSLMTGVSGLTNILPKKTLLWKLKLLESAAEFSNSNLHSVNSEVLILASGKDSLLPSKSEAQRLSNTLKNSTVRFFKYNGHALLMEEGINLLTTIKCTCTYRRSRKRDFVTDFLPISMSEFHAAFDRRLGLLRLATSPIMFSTLPDGEIVRGLKGVPDQGPILLVGYHMLFGAEIGSLVEEFLREKNVMVHGLGHPEMFTKSVEETPEVSSGFDYIKLFGAIPVTSSNFFKLLSRKAHVLLYPGGAREVLHRKGEEYKLFWPEETEFVRMAARFGAKIVPFGVVGEDDLVELILDYDDMMRIPFIREMIQQRNQTAARVREGSEKKGEVSNQDIFIPGFVPKLPGRFYFLFGKPMETEGKEEIMKNRVHANEFYQTIKSEVERSMAYLRKKREEDPYRGLFDRLFYRVVSAPVHQDPTFDL